MNTTEGLICAGFEVVTETGIQLGWVNKVELNLDDEFVTNLTLTSVRLPSLISWLASTYKVSSESIVHIGSTRVLTREGTEEQILNFKLGVLERFGLRRLPWLESDKQYIFPMHISHQGYGNEDIDGTGSKKPTPLPPSPNNTDSSVSRDEFNT